jgi:hypothetical protein
MRLARQVVAWLFVGWWVFLLGLSVYERLAGGYAPPALGVNEVVLLALLPLLAVLGYAGRCWWIAAPLAAVLLALLLRKRSAVRRPLA